MLDCGLSFMRDGSGKEAIAQGRFQIGDKFLKDAWGGLDGRLGCGRLGYGLRVLRRRF